MQSPTRILSVCTPIVAALALGAAGDSALAGSGRPENIIVLIGDGAGYNTLQATAPVAGNKPRR